MTQTSHETRHEPLDPARAAQHFAYELRRLRDNGDWWRAAHGREVIDAVLGLHPEYDRYVAGWKPPRRSPRSSS